MPKKYQCETKRTDPDDGDYAEFDTWGECQEWFIRQRSFGLCMMWVNNKPVKLSTGILVNDEPFDTTVPPLSEGLYQALKPPTVEEVASILQPSRRAVSTGGSCQIIEE